MKITGELIQDKIIVSKSKDVGRLYNKSHFGTPLSGNKLKLDLLEAVFLLDEEKIHVFQNKKEISFSNLFNKAANQIPEFGIKYLAFKDLRRRGYAIRLYDKKKNVTFYKINKKDEDGFFISVFSERDLLDIKKTRELVKDICKGKNCLWFAIVDEEGDITYYHVSSLNLKGKTKAYDYKKLSCILLENRTIIFDKKQSKLLFDKEFYGKPFGDGLQLSLVEALFLHNLGILDVYTRDDKKLSKSKFLEFVKKVQPDISMRLQVFNDLKKRGFIVKTGFKFGSHFRAYTGLPDETHAEYLVHVVPGNFKEVWSEISRAVRLAHSVNKEIVFACVSKNNIEYVGFGRLRP